MSRLFNYILIALIGCATAWITTTYALEPTTIPGGDQIAKGSITVIGADSANSVDAVKGFGLRILGILRMVIAGVALIYLVMIGAHMILGSDNEETVKTQRKQIYYALIGFVFLNIPSLIYQVFSPETAGNGNFIGQPPSWGATTGSFFWNTAGYDGMIGNLIAFLRVFAFGIAVTMFTWGAFSLITSGADDEKRKQSKNRLIYGVIGLIFLGFVQLWGSVVAGGDFIKAIPALGNVFLTLALYFAAPVAIFTLMWGAYTWITSAGDEDRMKK